MCKRGVMVIYVACEWVILGDIKQGEGHYIALINNICYSDSFDRGYVF